MLALVFIGNGCVRYNNTSRDQLGEARLVVGVLEDHIRFQIEGINSRQVVIRELEPWHVHDPAVEYPVVWSGKASTPDMLIPRLNERGGDRLYRQFLLEDARSGRAHGEPQFVTDFSELPVRTHPLLFPESIKGLTCVIDIADAVELGVMHSNSGIGIERVVDWSNPDSPLTHRVDGVKVPMDEFYIGLLDEQMIHWMRHDILYTPILINMLPEERHPDDPLIHPQTDMVNNPMGLGAFNMTSEEGVRTYIAAVEFLVERYTRENAELGQIAAMVIGNEIQAHWTWHNMGDAPAEQVIREYTLAMRLAWLAARSIHRDFRIFNSMTHHWSISGYLNDPMKEISGIDLLDGILERGRAQGDFPWEVGFHPYPENLFEAAWWNDGTATMRFDSPRVTFRNLEVLEAWLAQPRYLYNGNPRRIILSEQGFHEHETEEGEILQAAAYAASWVKVSQMPTIDIYHLHRHAHHPDEGGLRLGVRDASLNSDGTWTLGRKLKLYDVFKAAGTPQQEEVFAFALDVIGISSWDEMAPNHDIETEMRIATGPDYLLDLYNLALDARVEGIDRVYFEAVIRDGGFPANAIYQHPPEEGDGRLIFDLELPSVGHGESLVLRFDTAMKISLSDDGVEWRVEVDDEEVFIHRQQSMPPVSHEVDLTAWAGRQVELVLITNCIGNMIYDWSLWIQPRIVKVENVGF